MSRTKLTSSVHLKIMMNVYCYWRPNICSRCAEARIFYLTSMPCQCCILQQRHVPLCLSLAHESISRAEKQHCLKELARFFIFSHVGMTCLKCKISPPQQYTEKETKCFCTCVLACDSEIIRKQETQPRGVCQVLIKMKLGLEEMQSQTNWWNHFQPQMLTSISTGASRLHRCCGSAIVHSSILI